MQILTERQERILDKTILAHIDSAQPVGSRLLTEEYCLGYSPATIRHEMGRLEEMGFLRQPHISAGRVPTDDGYRYYVDYCLKHRDRTGRDYFDRETCRFFDESEDDEIDAFAEKVSALIASVAEEAGLVVVLKKKDGVRKRPSGLHKCFLRGTTYFLDKPEFHNVEKIRPLFRVFDQKDDLMDWITQRTSAEKVVVTIGHENEPEPLRDCSVVSMAYEFRNSRQGCIAVIGPRRMRYMKSIALVAEMTPLVGQWIAKKEFVQ
ncbi:MAG: hypothetical protein H6757_02400 [Candidatus Omnitrophica bacterium]|nr:hypothetical protein [Candidatus Omnitrophota bacterium]